LQFVQVRGSRIDGNTLGLDDQGTALGHGIAGIGRQVHEHLLDLPGGRQDRHVLAGQRGPDLDVLSQDARHERFHAAHDLVDTHKPGLEHLLAAEGQDLARESFCPLGRLQDLACVEVGLAPLGNVLLEQRRPTTAGSVVGSRGRSARKPSDRLHLLRLHEQDSVRRLAVTSRTSSIRR
jgi:hypothetical protein